MGDADYGLIVYGEHGAIQIDGETCCVNYKGRVGASTSNFNDMGSYCRGEISGLPEGMVFHDSSVPLSVRGWNAKLNSRTIYSRIPASCNFYSFSDNRTFELSDYGLEVYNSNGDIVFSSSWGPLKIVNVFSINGNNPGVNDSVSWTIPSGCVVAMSTTTEYMVKSGSHSASIYGGALNISGNVLTYSWVHMGTFNTWDDIKNTDIPYYYGYDSTREVQILVAKLDYI